MGPEITLHMLTGAISGWACLSPLAKSQGWAPGSIDDWDTGSRGWVVWISLSALIADAVVKIGWICVQPFLTVPGSEVYSNIRIYSQKLVAWLRRKSRYSYQYTGISGNVEEIDEHQSSQHSRAWKPISRFTKGDFLGLAFLVSVLICTGTTTYVFRSKIPWYYVVLSVLLALPMAVIGIRTLGESDYNPQSGLGKGSHFYSSLSARLSHVLIIIRLASITVILCLHHAKVESKRRNSQHHLCFNFYCRRQPNRRSCIRLQDWKPCWWITNSADVRTNRRIYFRCCGVLHQLQALRVTFPSSGSDFPDTFFVPCSKHSEVSPREGITRRSCELCARFRILLHVCYHDENAVCRSVVAETHSIRSIFCCR